ncbi:MAG: di-heme oxidoredictase family protein [Rhodospirillaceae bacterium]
MPSPSAASFAALFGLSLMGCAHALDTSVRDRLLAVPLSPNLGGETTRPVATSEAYTFITANAPADVKPGFTFGNQLFNTLWTPHPGPQPTTDGLGPLFNREACSDCHVNNGRGAPPETVGAPMDSILVRLSVPGQSDTGGPLGVPHYGDQLQDRGIDGVPAEGRAIMEWQEIAGTYSDGTAYSLRKPVIRFEDLAYGPMPDTVMTSPRVANAVIGLGLLEMVSDDLLYALADPDDADGDGISGRVNVVWDERDQKMATGKFGWKANVSNLTNQNSGAAVGDMGITTPVRPTDNCESTQTACLSAANHDGIEMTGAFLNQLNVYMRRLAVPKQRGATLPEVVRGQTLFMQAGCQSCHIPTLETGVDPRTQDLAEQTIHPFTDLLLHDLGDGLSDGRPDFLASGSEWRTAPLWGIGLTEKVSGHTYFLHDGRARGLAEAILWHGGEAEASKEVFRTMPTPDRADLISFLESL